MDWQDITLFLHIMGTVAWIGTAGLLSVLQFRYRQLAESDALKVLFAVSEWLSIWVFVPAVVITSVTGFVLVGLSPRANLGQFWIQLSLGMLVVAGIFGGGLISPATIKARQMLEQFGWSHPSVQRQLHYLAVISRVELAILAGLVLEMVVKPRPDTLWFYVVVVGMVILPIIPYLFFRFRHVSPAPSA
jgi:uncharacterized membrane protein